MKRKRITMLISVISVLVLTAWGIFDSSEPERPNVLCSSVLESREINATHGGGTFEDALGFATDVVIAQCVGSRPFGRTLTEFEFEVSERVKGNAADRIFIYVNNTLVSSYAPGNISFNTETEYLLPLQRLTSPNWNTHEDGFFFLDNIVIDLDDLSQSTMRNDSLNDHSEVLDFNDDSLTRETIIAYVDTLTRDNPPVRDIIRSENIKDIINGSPYVLVVEINELSSTQPTPSDWADTEFYNVTIVEALKGSARIGAELTIVFRSGTVFLGEQHIVAVDRNYSWSSFTSRNSLFSMDQLDEIIEIIDN